MDSLHVAGVWRSPEHNRVFDRAPPNTSLSDMTVLELALELQHEGFLFQVVALRQTRSRLPAFTLQLEQRVTYLRHKASRSEFSRFYLTALLAACRDQIQPAVPIEHLRDQKYYKRILGIGVDEPHRRRGRHQVCLLEVRLVS